MLFRAILLKFKLYLTLESRKVNNLCLCNTLLTKRLLIKVGRQQVTI